MPMHYYIHTLLYALLSHTMHGMGSNQCFCIPYCLVSNQDGLVTSWFNDRANIEQDTAIFKNLKICKRCMRMLLISMC